MSRPLASIASAPVASGVPGSEDALRNGLLAMAVLLAVTFPLGRDEASGWALTILAEVIAISVIVALWRRWATPLTIVRLGVLAGVLVMTYGIVDTVGGASPVNTLEVRFLGYAVMASILLPYVFGSTLGAAASVGAQAVWIAIVVLHPDGGSELIGPQFLLAISYSAIALVVLWGVLRTYALLRVERDVLRDETRRERAGRRARLETEQRRARLMAEAAHELRAPLATITAAAETLDAMGDELDQPMRHRVIAAIRHATTRLDRRTIELLDAARDRVTVIPANRVEVDAARVVRASIEDLHLMTNEHPVELELQEPAPAFLDPDGLDHILTNLVHNAIKYTPDGAPVVVRLWRELGTTVLEVADGGQGIPAGVRDTLFTPWTRDPSHSEQEGSGVGLAVARTWARRHGGDIVLLETDVGATFRVTLPDERADVA